MRKFVDVIETDEWEVLTPSGFQPITHINKTIEYREFMVSLSNGQSLICADDHILIQANGEEVFAKDSLGCTITTVDGCAEVTSVVDLGRYSHMYDLTVGDDEHVYYTNGILSHNTSTTSITILWYILFNQHKTVAILANKAAAAREVLSRIKDMYEQLPHWLQQGVVTWNKGDIALGNGCKVLAAATSASAIRGKSVAFLYIDEAAFIPTNQAQEFFESVYPTISSGKESKISMSSTPKGLNHFYKFWTEAKEGRSDFKPFEVAWDAVPHRNEEWKAKTIADMGQAMWDQEFECQFLGSTNSLIPSTVLRKLVFQTPIKENPTLKIWEDSKPDRNYFIAVDCARGNGGDYSVAQVIDITEFPFKQVAIFRSNTLSYMLMPKAVVQLAQEYNNAFVLVELNDIGESVADSIYYEEEYENLLTTGTTKNKTSLGSWQNARNGLMTTNTSKNQGCNVLKSMLESEKLILNDITTIQELSNFVSKGKSYAAEEGMNDDCVMALVVFCWATTQGFFKEMTDRDFRRTYIEETEHLMMEELAPMAFDNGIHHEDEDTSWLHA